MCLLAEKGTSMALILYDLAGADAQRRFSPYCWRIRLAIADKGMEVETIPWRFTEKEVIAFSGQGRVPVLVDSGKTTAGSWAIANYLEREYPTGPSLFGPAPAASLMRFVESWTDTVLLPGIAPLILVDVFSHLHEKDKIYFRSSREQRLGMTLEEFCADRDKRVIGFRQSLEPLRTTLKSQPFLGGEVPNYADYIVLGGFMWARSTSPFKLLQSGDLIASWYQSLLDRFPVARDSPGYLQ
jgi:glutathione S-transferase